VERVGLRVVASSDDRVRAIRDHVLPLLRERGALEVQRDTVRLVELLTGPWIFRHWTPFNELHPGEASSPGYRHAVERQHTRQQMPYGLDVWHGTRVLRIHWAADGSIEVAGFIRGSWEDAVLTL
jgi:hypothetical protein